MYREWLENLVENAPRGTKARLAKHLGLDPTMISKMVSGARDISAEELRGISTFFNAVPPGLPTQGRIERRIYKVRLKRPDLADVAEEMIEGALRSIEERDEGTTQ